ncbi:MAG: hypothetical protein KJ607_01400, partial [Bacteroidetes bacterium]|nr:hypothetical protein [Bacteroidota bacterium]
MRKIILFFISIPVFIFDLSGQTVLFSENFEACAEGAITAAGFHGWKLYTVTASNNKWAISDNCAITGLKSMPIYNGLGTYCDHTNGDNAEHVAYYAALIDATSYIDLKLNFKWKNAMAEADGYGMAVWSTDGTAWNDVSATKYHSQSTVQTVTDLDLSAANGTLFYIGFRWIYSGNVTFSNPVNIDDISVTGIDPTPKAINTITYNQASTADVYKGTTDNEILRIDFNVTGGSGTLFLNSIEVKSLNTDDTDVTAGGVKLYRTATTAFSTGNLLGTAQSLSAGTVTFSSLNFDLPTGNTYVWVTYDIEYDATLYNTVDAKIETDKIDVAGATYPAAEESPPGERIIDYFDLFCETFEDCGSAVRLLPSFPPPMTCNNWYAGGSGGSKWDIITGNCELDGNYSLSVGGVFFPGDICQYDPATISDMVAYHEVNSTGYNDIVIDFIWQCSGIAGEDYGKVCYSTDESAWIDIDATEYQGQTGSSQVVTDLPLPAGCHNTTFFIGFRWKDCDNAGCLGGASYPGFIVDNICVKGTLCSPPDAPTTIASDRNNFCADDAETISLTASGGGDGGSILTWYAGGCGSGGPIGTGSPLIIASPATTTTYYVRYEGGCGNSTCTGVTVTVVPVPVATALNNGPLCEGGTLTLTGGPGGMDSYAWSGPDSFGSTEQSPTVSTSATTSMVGIYYLTVTGGACSDVVSTFVTINSQSVVPAGISATVNPVCQGLSTQLSVSGGSLGTGAGWVWYSGGCGVGGAVGSGSSITVSPSSATTYYVRAEGTCNTTSCASITVNVNPPPSATAANNSPVCAGDTLILAGGPGGMSSYSWSGPDLFTSSLQNPTVSVNATPAMSGTYTITVTDINGCTDIEITTVTVTSALSVTTSATDHASCNGDSDGIAVATPSGGTSPYDYNWSSGGTDATESGLAAGTYAVTLSDVNGCTASNNVTITEPDILTAATSVTDILCYGDKTGAIDISPSGGTTPYSFVWSDGTTTEDISNLFAGTYFVSVYDINNCLFITSADITEPVSALSASASATDAPCNGDNGSVDLTPGGGTTPYTYLWSTGATTQNISGEPAGSYNVTVTDANNCIETASVMITQPQVLFASVSTVVSVTCNAESDGSATVTASGGNGGFIYLWDVAAESQITQTATNLTAGVYSVTV